MFDSSEKLRVRTDRCIFSGGRVRGGLKRGTEAFYKVIKNANVKL